MRRPLAIAPTVPQRPAHGEASRGHGAAGSRPGVAAAVRSAYHGMMRKRTTRQRLGRRSANLLLIAGGLTLAFPFWSAAYTHFEQRHLSADYQRASASFSSTARPQTSTLALLHTP